ncbi:MAG: fumarate hydratase [Spirochaetales bacterium]|jgi:fumarate hydratase subunit alpha|nr:fumarate hydratase [Exilispira sp.]NMC67946.1 fumarate hydratase [Spirochaetales bacterium]
MKDRIILFNELKNKIYELILKTSYDLPSDVYIAIEESIKKEESSLGISILHKLLKNADIAKSEKMPICQDTGTAVFFIEMGEKVKIKGGSIKDAIFEATKDAYDKGYLRKSMVKDPIFDRTNTNTNLPPIIHFDIIEGEKIKIKFAPKGGGAENMSSLKMFKPLDTEEAITNFVVDTVLKAGGNPCPPIIIGIGIGGNFEESAILAKKALFRKIGERNSNPKYAKLEEKIKNAVNNTGIGPQGLGGRITCLDLFIEYFPCHIASLPVAINLNCHAARHGEIEI